MADEPVPSSLPPVAIAAFNGPLDLLLHLIRVNEVSITDIPIVEITEQYTAYLDAMRELDLDVASEYVALAAELIYIKSKMLLPRAPGEATADPRADLARRLLEYEKLQALGRNPARDRHAARRDLAAAAVGDPAGGRPRRALDVSLFDIIDVFRRATDRLPSRPSAGPGDPPAAIFGRRQDDRAARAPGRRPGPCRCSSFSGQMRYRAEAVTAFLACLELIRLGVVRAFQVRPFAEIHVTRTDVAFTAQQIRDNYAE